MLIGSHEYAAFILLTAAVECVGNIVGFRNQNMDIRVRQLGVTQFLPLQELTEPAHGVTAGTEGLVIPNHAKGDLGVMI